MKTPTFKSGRHVDINKQSLETVITLPFNGFFGSKVIEQVKNYVDITVAEAEHEISHESVKLAKKLDEEGFAGQAWDNIKLEVATSYTHWLLTSVGEIAHHDGLVLSKSPMYVAGLAPSEYDSVRPCINVNLARDYLPSIDEIDAVYCGFKTDLLVVAEARFWGINGFSDLVEPDILAKQDTASRLYNNEHYASLVFELLCYRVFEVDSVSELEDLYFDVCDSDALYSHLYDKYNSNSLPVYKALGYGHCG